MSDGGRSAGVEVRGVEKRFGGTPVLRGVDLTVAQGAIVVLLGPSGCGKTTLLRTIAGLERVDRGVVSIGQRVVDDGTTPVAAERRGVGMVFQDWALFPHLSVGKNVGYGVRSSAERPARVTEALARVGLAGLEQRMPATLSGGQKQRVALARALAPEPAVLLLDEPFSNLDTSLRTELRAEVHRVLRDLEVTAIFVTHDQQEAFAIGDEVAVMHDGTLLQQAAPAQLYAAPATPWLAAFVGEANLVEGTADGPSARTTVGIVPLRSPGRGQVQVLVRPEDLEVRPGGAAVVTGVEYYGHDSMYEVRLDDGVEVRARVGAAPRHQAGDRVDLRYRGELSVAWPLSSP